jgi:hypothetical protein
MQDLAADTTLGTYSPTQLWAGESPIVTSNIAAAAGVAFAKYEVYAVDASGNAIKHDPTATAGTAPTIAVGFFAQAVAAGQTGPVFIGGAPNHAALGWHASLTTLATRRAAFKGTDIHVMALL